MLYTLLCTKVEKTTQPLSSVRWKAVRAISGMHVQEPVQLPANGKAGLLGPPRAMRSMIPPGVPSTSDMCATLKRYPIQDGRWLPDWMESGNPGKLKEYRQDSTAEATNRDQCSKNA